MKKEFEIKYNNKTNWGDGKPSYVSFTEIISANSAKEAIEKLKSSSWFSTGWNEFKLDNIKQI